MVDGVPLETGPITIHTLRPLAALSTIAQQSKAVARGTYSRLVFLAVSTVIPETRCLGTVFSKYLLCSCKPLVALSIFRALFRALQSFLDLPLCLGQPAKFVVKLKKGDGTPVTGELSVVYTDIHDNEVTGVQSTITKDPMGGEGDYVVSSNYNISGTNHSTPLKQEWHHLEATADFQVSGSTSVGTC